MSARKYAEEVTYVDCSCSGTSHALVFRLTYIDMPEGPRDTILYMDGTWCRPAPIWKRAWRALLYVLRGMECRYWDEFEHVFKEESAARIAAVLARYQSFVDGEKAAQP